jgi:hypothetical protein
MSTVYVCSGKDPNSDKLEIPKHKHQIPNKLQHAAQAPALRVTEIQNNKHEYDLKIFLTSYETINIVIWNLFAIWCLVFEILAVGACVPASV